MVVGILGNELNAHWMVCQLVRTFLKNPFDQFRESLWKDDLSGGTKFMNRPPLWTRYDSLFDLRPPPGIRYEWRSCHGEIRLVLIVGAAIEREVDMTRHHDWTKLGDEKPGFFFDLANGRLFKRLALLDPSAYREPYGRPVRLRRVNAAEEQHSSIRSKQQHLRRPALHSGHTPNDGTKRIRRRKTAWDRVTPVTGTVG